MYNIPDEPGYYEIYDDEVFCCYYEEGAWAWRDVLYDLSEKKFYIYTFEVCGSDLSDERRTARTLISEEEALGLMDEAHKEYLRKRIEEFAG